MVSGSRTRLPSRRVRVVGKITSHEGETASSSDHPWISVIRSEGDHASISFGDQSACRKECYKLDWCYEQEEGLDKIFAGEVKPLIQGIFQGINACVIAYGARGTGKTQMLRGSEDNPGLAPMAVSEILQFADEIGGTVAISCYEVFQDHVFDILEPKEQEVLVLEDASRRIQLKGLSQIPVKTLSDFNKLYFHVLAQRKSSQKVADETSIRSHKGLIVYISSVDKESDSAIVGRMNFVDLAGYEDTKQKGNARPQLVESIKVNKSLYALLNVIFAQNANEAYVPYRESRLTRFLQDFICRPSGAVLITCLKQGVCQDTIHAVTLASRSSQVVIQRQHESGNKCKRGLRFVPSCSSSFGGLKSLDNSAKKREIPLLYSVEKQGNPTRSMTKERPQKLSSLVKKSGTSKMGSTEKQENVTSSTTKGRILFWGMSPITNSLKNNLLVSSVIEPSLRDEIKPDVIEDAEPLLQEEGTCILTTPNVLGSCTSEVDSCPQSEQRVLHDSDIGNEHDARPSIHPHDSSMQIESETPVANMVESSPPLSERLREISNSLKLLSTQPLSIKSPRSVDVSCAKQGIEDYEDGSDPKTPRVPFPIRLDDNQRNINTYTPQAFLKTRSTGLKKSLIQECLAFLNCANKGELKELKGIGEKRATYILQLREDNPEPFKDVDDIHKHLGLSSKQIKEMMTKVLGEF